MIQPVFQQHGQQGYSPRDCARGKSGRGALNSGRISTLLHCMLINCTGRISDSVDMSTEQTHCRPFARLRNLAAAGWLAAVMLVASSTAALAQQGQQPQQDGDSSMVITLEQMQKSLEKYRTERDGIVVHFVLPSGWELVEQGIDPETGEEIQEMGIYALLARRPVPGDAPTDFIFEMDIYDRRLMEDLPPDLSEEERQEDFQFMSFLNAQISINARAGMKMTSEVRDIVPKQYRKGMFWVPIYYESQANGTKLLTFTTAVDRKLVMLKFLISKDAMELHRGLVSLIINNSWVITEEELREIEAEAGIKDPTP